MKTNKINILLFFIIMISTLSCSNNNLEFENNDNPFNIVTIKDYIVNIELSKNFVKLEELDRIIQKIIYGDSLFYGFFGLTIIFNLVLSNINSPDPYFKSWLVTVYYSPRIIPRGFLNNDGKNNPRLYGYIKVFRINEFKKI